MHKKYIIALYYNELIIAIEKKNKVRFKHTYFIFLCQVPLL